MGNTEMFDSALRSAGDLAGVFEYDGETGYFYLYNSQESSTQKVLDAIRIVIGDASFEQADLAIRWDAEETKVGLYIRDRIEAVFDIQTGAKYGGDYRKNDQSRIPPEVLIGFRHHDT